MSFSLVVTQGEVISQLDRLSRILADMPATAMSRYALSEIVLIRAASIFEESLASVAYKLACGAQFPDGNCDNFIAQSRSLAGARTSMRLEGGARATPKEYLRWTRATYISDSVRGVLDPASHFVATCQRFGPAIAEIFEVRNHAAHKSSTSRKNYMKWVKNQYGQERNIQLGYFLLTSNLVPIPNIERYLTSIRVIIDDLISGP